MNLPTFMFGAFTLVALIVSSALLGSSFDILQPDTMALLFDANTGQLKCDTLYGGSRDSSIRRFFVGLGQSFRFKFPLAARTIRFSNSGSAQSPLIVARTSEGAVVTMEIAVQYQLPRNAQRLCDIVYAYGTSYDTFFTNYVRGVARDAMGTFLVQDLWERRSTVGDAVSAAIRAELNARLGVFVNFQLQSLDIPDALQAEIENTTVQFQRISQAQLNLQRQNVSAITRQLQARVTGQIAVLNATFAATAVLSDANARAQAANFTNNAEAIALSSFKSTFGMTNQQVLTLAYIDAVQSVAADRIFIAAEPPPLARPNV
jgi:regulator of protease activity HflC (stomatin/prohibitin superfamily)